MNPVFGTKDPTMSSNSWGYRDAYKRRLAGYQDDEFYGNGDAVPETPDLPPQDDEEAQAQQRNDVRREPQTHPVSIDPSDDDDDRNGADLFFLQRKRQRRDDRDNSRRRSQRSDSWQRWGPHR